MDIEKMDFSKELKDILTSLDERVGALEKEVAALRGASPAQNSDVDDAGLTSEAVDNEPIDLDIEAELPDEPEEAELSESSEEAELPETSEEPELPEASEELELPESHEDDLPEAEKELPAPSPEEELPEPQEEAELSEAPEEAELPEPQKEPELPEEPSPVEAELPEEPSPVEPAGTDLFGDTEEEDAVGHSTRRKSINDSESAHTKKAVIDVMSEKLPWKTDMPGTEVKDIRSAISLNDRVMFINTLFREDAMLFQDTLTRLNAMKTLREAEKYLKETFPEWKMSSGAVYRFMMAVRRKIRQ